ncbi:MAG: RT0821/Lpp0805 family surface protein [Roseibium sp.]
MRSYTARPAKIQPLMLCMLVLGMIVSGCSQVSMQMGSADVTEPTLLTGSISSNSDVAFADISSDDRLIIAQNLDELSGDLSGSSDLAELSLPWLNTASGNSGTVSAFDRSTFEETGCLNFQTTANTIVGIKLYAGTACRDITQKFAVTTLTVVEA